MCDKQRINLFLEHYVGFEEVDGKRLQIDSSVGRISKSQPSFFGASRRFLSICAAILEHCGKRSRRIGKQPVNSIRLLVSGSI